MSGRPLARNTPSLYNVAWNTAGFFWDGGSASLESQAYGSITDRHEMGASLHLVIARLKADPYYVRAFARAFGDTIRSQRIVQALAQYQRSLVSAGSRYDRYRSGHNDAFTAKERDGLAMFNRYCRSCHAGELFTDHSFHNNGLDVLFVDTADEQLRQGRYRISFDLTDLGRYKTPSLRNVAITAPYMHDGRFSTLAEVLEHYRNGVRYSNTLSDRLVNGGKTGIPVTREQADAIQAFLLTLTDEKSQEKALRSIKKGNRGQHARYGAR